MNFIWQYPLLGPIFGSLTLRDFTWVKHRTIDLPVWRTEVDEIWRASVADMLFGFAPRVIEIQS